MKAILLSAFSFLLLPVFGQTTFSKTYSQSLYFSQAGWNKIVISAKVGGAVANMDLYIDGSKVSENFILNSTSYDNYNFAYKVTSLGNHKMTLTAKQNKRDITIRSINIIPGGNDYVALRDTGAIIGNQKVVAVPLYQGNTLAGTSFPNTQKQALVSFPDDYFAPGNENKTYPLIFFFHGTVGGKTNDISVLADLGLPRQISLGEKIEAFDKDGVRRKFIVVAPHAAGTNWSMEQSKDKYIYEYLKNVYMGGLRIDTTRIYATGQSAGGWATYTNITDDINWTKKFAAMCVAGSAGIEKDRRNNLQNVVTADLPLYHIVGTNDKIVGYTDTTYYHIINTLNPTKPNVLSFVIGGEHDESTWGPTYDTASTIFTTDNKRVNLYTWFLQFQRGSNAENNDDVIGNQKIIKLPKDSLGTQTQALLSLPDDYSKTEERYPLIISLHGSAVAGTNISNLLKESSLAGLISKGFVPEAINPVDRRLYKFITVSPQAPAWSYWSMPIKSMLESVIERYRIDTTRIYIVGHLAGGYGVWTCVTDDTSLVKRIAAIIPLDAAGVEDAVKIGDKTVYRYNNLDNAAKYDLPVWNICGENDVFWPNAVDYTQKINKLNPKIPVKLTGLPGVGNNAWEQGYDPRWRVEGFNIYEWMLQYSRTPVIDRSKLIRMGVANVRIRPK